MRKQIWEIGGSGYAYIQDKHRVKERSLQINGDVNEDVNGYSKQYLTFEAIEDSTFSLTQNACEYSLNNGRTWVSLSAGTNTPTVPAGSKIMFKATNPTILEYDGIGTFSSTGKFNVSGNIMSMLCGDDFIGQNDLTGKNYAFSKLFKGCTNVVEAHNLVLPATTLYNYCYSGMFNGCTSLTAVPQLPATTLADGCYSYMFQGCTSLTTAPELPATILVDYCYGGMFYKCNSLTTAPELHATILVDWCYESMFEGCNSLNSIVMLATDISADRCLYNWVSDVASTGAFVKHPNMTSLTTGKSGIPEGWTVEDYQE